MKKQLKMMAAVCAAAFLALPALAAEAMPRSEWHAKVSECAQNAQVLKDTIQQVAPAEQAALLAEVNEAISKMPGSDEVKAAKFYAANKAAAGSASKEALKDVLAEMFATVPPEYLTDINERFAKELFGRSSAITDEKFVDLATNTLAVINARCEKAENSGVRETFAVLMFLRASGGSPENLAETLVATMPDAKNRELAANEWIKPAMGEGQEQTYDPMLGVAQAGEEPDHAIVTRLAGDNASMAALLADLAAESSADMKTPTANLAGGSIAASSGIAGTAMDGIALNRVPRAYVNSKEGVGGNAEGRNDEDENPYYTHSRGSSAGSGSGGSGSISGGGGVHPSPYRGQ